MHRLIQDHLEEVLDKSSLPSGHPAAAHLVKCVECRDEVDTMRVQNELLRSWSLTGDVPEVEPRPGFYARVLERIEAGRPVSIWALFTESPWGRHVASVSLAFAMVVGIYVVVGERELATHTTQSAAVDPLYPSGSFDPDVMNANASGNGAVFAALVSYHER